jgi:hypothetical protein
VGFDFLVLAGSRMWAFPLTRLQGVFTDTFAGPNACPCVLNDTATFKQDAIVHLVVSSPDANDNSLWCYSSAGEDLCSFTWNKGTGDKKSCSFFLPVRGWVRLKTWLVSAEHVFWQVA